MAPSSEITLPAPRRARKSISAHTDLSKAMEKENATTDIAMDLRRKTSRSKSVGPGGLDALRQGSGNRRASLAAPPKPPRSILKPTIAPLPEIPPLKKQSASHEQNTESNSLIADELSGSKVALRTEEEQQAAAREREERERRDARRKSLATRRVSFAAEATLHTFHEVEYMQDRRKSSSASNARNSAPQNQDDQSDSQQRKRRTSSLLNNDEDNITSTIYSSDSEPADAVEEIAANEDEEEEDSNSDSDDGTMMSIETEEVTGTTVASDRSMEVADESSTLDEALRIAARRAGTQRHIEEESDDGEEVIPSFGWAKKGNQQAPSPSTQQPDNEQQGGDEEGDDTEMEMDMDITRPVGKIIKPPPTENTENEPEQDISMDVTSAIGAILSQKDPPQSFDDSNEMEEATMELTTAIGGIHRHVHEETDIEDENEDMSMELTTVMGGLLSRQKEKDRTVNREILSRPDEATMDMTVGLGRIMSTTTKNTSPDEDADVDRSMNMDLTMGMDMTVGLGRIISAPSQNKKQYQKYDGDTSMNLDATMGMDMTMAMGGIIKSTPTSPRTLGKRILANELPRTALEAVSLPSPKKRLPRESIRTPERAHSGPLPSREEPFQERPESPPAPEDNTPSSPMKFSTPKQNLVSPTRKGLRSQTKTPPTPSPRKSPLRNSSRTPSPQKLPQGRVTRSVARNDINTSLSTPTLLTPQKRTLTGVGADRNGLGSPQVAAILERRESITDSATQFIPGKRTVVFEDPRELRKQVDKDDHEQAGSQSLKNSNGRDSQDDKDLTLNLREMIDSLSPKRNLLRGRKSLHVGSARGVLGKRPAELDDEEAEENDGVKRLKGHQGSPVKNVRLQQPPSKEETTGRLMKPRLSFDQQGRAPSHSLSSPIKGGQAMKPQQQGRFNETKENQTIHEVQLHQSPKNGEARYDADEDRIHLQDFLNMTSIRFMELTTTKRRHTVAPGAAQNGLTLGDQDDCSVERCVVAGACTVPMLELYQHSCRELKKYISEGRRIVREIETETFEENPPLFQEYISATTEVKALMDNQFKNVKTHARHLSKAMWYEWRMKLQDGLKEGLVNIVEGMNGDLKILEDQEALLESVMPTVVSRYESLLEESRNLEEAARELADCNPAELEAARDELVGLDEDIAHKKKLIAQLRREFQESEVEVEEFTAKKAKCLAEIQDSEQIREECRGWTSTEVNNLKERVDAIEKEHGWAVTGISGSTMSMTYEKEIELVFDITSFQPHQPNSSIDLWYIADSREINPISKTAEKDFFLQCIRDHLRALPQSRTKLPDFLRLVQTSWDKASQVSHQISRINVSFPTKVTRTSDSSIAITSSLLLVPLETRVEVMFNLHGFSGPDGVNVNVSTDANVVYGEQFNVGKVGEFLATRVGNRLGAGEDQWCNVVVELHERLIAKGQK